MLRHDRLGHRRGRRPERAVPRSRQPRARHVRRDRARRTPRPAGRSAGAHDHDERTEPAPHRERRRCRPRGDGAGGAREDARASRPRNLDVYVSTVGGVRFTEPAADLAIAIAVAGSVRNESTPKALAAIGELSLAGEVRPVTQTAAAAQRSRPARLHRPDRQPLAHRARRPGRRQDALPGRARQGRSGVLRADAAAQRPRWVRRYRLSLMPSTIGITSPAAHTRPTMRNSIRRVCRIARRMSSVGLGEPLGARRSDAQASSAAMRSVGVACIGCGPAMSMNTVAMSSSCRPRNARSQPGVLQGDAGRKRRRLVRGVAEEQQRDLAASSGRGRSTPRRHRAGRRRPAGMSGTTVGPCRRAKATAASPASAGRRSAPCCGTRAARRRCRSRCAPASDQRIRPVRQSAGTGQARKPRSRASEPARCSSDRRLGGIRSAGQDRDDDALVLGVRVLDVARQQRERVEPRVDARAVRRRRARRARGCRPPRRSSGAAACRARR